MIFKKNFKKKVSHFTHLLLTNFLFPVYLAKKKNNPSPVEGQNQILFCKFLFPVTDDKTNIKKGLLSIFREQMKACKLTQSNLAHEKIKANTALRHFLRRKEKENKVVRTWKLEKLTKQVQGNNYKTDGVFWSVYRQEVDVS